MEQRTDLLKQFEALKDVPEPQLVWLEEHSKLIKYKDGDFVSTEGNKMGGPHFIFKGRILLFIKQGNEHREIAILGKGGIFGYLPYSRGIISNFYSQAIGDVEILSFNTDEIRIMIRDHFELTQALVHIMNNRVREFTALQQQNDKMAALGKLAAGLAHELNNPAAALVSDSLSLRQHLRLEPVAFKELTTLHLEAFQVDGVNEELFKVLDIKDKTRLTLREKTKREEAITDWLEEKGVRNAEEIAETFVDFNFSFDNLKVFDRFIPPHARSSVFNWILNVLVTEKMIGDIQISSTRIAELIKSIKIYTHMDRGSDKMSSNVHDGLRNTLSILGHKIRKGNIVVDENYDESLPPVMAYVGELNQVWTNLIDNALEPWKKTKRNIELNNGKRP